MSWCLDTSDMMLASAVSVYIERSRHSVCKIYSRIQDFILTRAFMLRIHLSDVTIHNTDCWGTWCRFVFFPWWLAKKLSFDWNSSLDFSELFHVFPFWLGGCNKPWNWKENWDAYIHNYKKCFLRVIPTLTHRNISLDLKGKFNRFWTKPL